MVEHYKEFGTFENYVPFQRLRIRKPGLNDAGYMSLKGITHVIASLKQDTVVSEKSVVEEEEIVPIRNEDDVKREQMIEHYKKFRTFSNYIPYQRLKLRKPKLTDFWYMRLKGIDFLIPRHLRNRKKFRFKFKPFLSHKAMKKMKSFYVYRNRINRYIRSNRNVLKKKISISYLIMILRFFFSSHKKYYKPFLRLVNSILIKIKKEKINLTALINNNKSRISRRDRPEQYKHRKTRVSNIHSSVLNVQSTSTPTAEHDKQP
jgi:hypothetical protein